MGNNQLSASIRKYGDVWDLKKCLAMLTQPFINSGGEPVNHTKS